MVLNLEVLEIRERDTEAEDRAPAERIDARQDTTDSGEDDTEDD